MCIHGILVDVWVWDSYVFESWVQARRWLDSGDLHIKNPVRHKAFVANTGEVYLCNLEKPCKFTKGS